MSEKMTRLREDADWVRTVLVHEPRGSGVMSGALITEPCHPEADMGVIYFEVGGYVPMCGHDTIGACTALLETGILRASEPETRVTFDTPAGLVRVIAEVRDGSVESVRFCNVPSFLYRPDVTVDVPGAGRVTCDLAYGGNFYAILPASAVGLEIAPENAGLLIQAGNRIRDTVNTVVKVCHPEKPFINRVTYVQFTGPPRTVGAHGQNCVVIEPASLDRSPCGTGTSARVAALHARGRLALGEEFVYESIIRTRFVARAVETTTVGDLPAVVPEIKGQAFVTGIHTFVVSPNDPLPEGFLLA
jgi:proline racemase